MSIPLIQKPEKDDINTSIIAIKRNIERINMLLGLVDNDSPDLSGFATKQELQDAVTELQPVDEVTVGNMQSVTSNAVAKNLPKVFCQEILLYTSGARSYTFNTTLYKSFVLAFEYYDSSLGGNFSFKFVKDENGTLHYITVSQPNNYIIYSVADDIITISIQFGQGGIHALLSGYVVEN